MSVSKYIERFELDDVFNDDLVKRMELRTLARGEHLVRIGEAIDYFYLLVEGKLKIYTFQENGKKVLIRFYRPLNAIGDLEYLSEYVPNAAVEALEQSKVLSVPMKELRYYTHDCPKFLRFVITQLSHKLYTYSKISSLNLVYPLENRVASYLWSVSRINDNRQLEEIRVNSLEEMANLLATSYRHLSRVLNKMQTNRVISRTRGNIKITDFKQLEKLAIDLFE
ncbi:MAG: cyclic nucleotide-binding domain-containing protein [Proteobacteria bacterium]|nr:cyclic nucleotide-binding domain-containing protein [Pseudomonadota bacterium]